MATLSRKFTIDVEKPNNIAIRMAQNDNNSRFINAQITRSGEIITFKDDEVIYLKMISSANNIFIKECSKVDSSTVSIEFTSNMLAASGIAKAQLVIYSGPATENNDSVEGDVVLSTSQFTILIFESNSDSGIKQTSEFGNLVNLIEKGEQVNEAIEKELVYAEQEKVREANEKQRIANENTRQQNEENRNTQENARQTNESNRQSEEEARVKAEESRVTAEQNRTIAENKRVDAENTRVEAENIRVEAETTRQDNETTRQETEEVRADAETERKNNETARQESEESRGNAEIARENNETTRQENENTRKENETARNENETTRQENVQKLLDEGNELIANMKSINDSNKYVLKSQLGVASTDNTTGIATLDSEGRVLESQLPLQAYDIIEGTANNTVTSDDGIITADSFTPTGDEDPCKPLDNTLYIDKTSFIIFYWLVAENKFRAVGSSLTLGETANTAYPGDKGSELTIKLDKTTKELDKTTKELDKTTKELDKTTKELDKLTKKYEDDDYELVTSVIKSTDWNNDQYSFENSYPSATCDISQLQAYGTEAQISAFGKAALVGTPQGNIITVTGDVPTIDVPIMFYVHRISSSSKIKTSTLYTNKWVDNKYSLESLYPIKDYDIIEIQPYGTAEQISAFGNAEIIGSPTENTLTALKTIPTIDIPIMFYTRYKGNVDTTSTSTTTNG